MRVHARECAQTQSCLFATPRTVARQAPLSMEFSRRKHSCGLPFPPPCKFPDPGIQTLSLASAALAGRLLTTVPPGKPHSYIYIIVPIFYVLRYFKNTIINSTHQGNLSFLFLIQKVRWESLTFLITPSTHCHCEKPKRSTEHGAPVWSFCCSELLLLSEFLQQNAKDGLKWHKCIVT